MNITDANSLSVTLDRLNEAFFLGKCLPTSARAQAAKWLASRQGLPGSYAGMFAPTEKDIQRGIQVFIGEKVTSRAAACDPGGSRQVLMAAFAHQRPRVTARHGK